MVGIRFPSASDRISDLSEVFILPDAGIQVANLICVNSKHLHNRGQAMIEYLIVASILVFSLWFLTQRSGLQNRMEIQKIIGQRTSKSLETLHQPIP